MNGETHGVWQTDTCMGLLLPPSLPLVTVDLVRPLAGTPDAAPIWPRRVHRRTAVAHRSTGESSLIEAPKTADESPFDQEMDYGIITRMSISQHIFVLPVLDRSPNVVQVQCRMLNTHISMQFGASIYGHRIRGGGGCTQNPW